MALTVLQLDSESISELGTSICRLPLQSGVHGGLSPTSKNPGSGLFQTKPVKDPRLKEKNFPRSPEVSHQACAQSLSLITSISAGTFYRFQTITLNTLLGLLGKTYCPKSYVGAAL